MVLLREPEVTRLYLEDIGIDGDNIKMRHKEMRLFAFHSSVVGYHTDRYQAVVKTVMNWRVP
jgi:hypothetical protein